MTYHNDFTLPAELREQIVSEGLDFIPVLMEILINAAMPAERSRNLRVHSFQYATLTNR